MEIFWNLIRITARGDSARAVGVVVGHCVEADPEPKLVGRVHQFQQLLRGAVLRANGAALEAVAQVETVEGIKPNRVAAGGGLLRWRKIQNVVAGLYHLR